MTQPNATYSSTSTPEDLFQRILDAMEAEPCQQPRIIHETLVLMCAQALRNTQSAYGNLFSQLSAVCRLCHAEPSLVRAAQSMRRNSNRHVPTGEEEFLQDCRALADLIAKVFSVAVPDKLASRLPKARSGVVEHRPIDYKYIRCVVRSVLADGITAEADQEDVAGEISVSFTESHEYLLRMVNIGTQLNLLDCSTADDGRIRPAIVILEPDFLVDISVLARCFEDYGHHPLLHTLNRMKARANSQAILLGNFAGAALDDIINNPQCSLGDTMRSNFSQKVLEYAACPGFDAVAFKRDASRQADNIRRAVDNLFATADRSKALLEPSFVCERLGIQGRVDLMTADKRLLVEQKSGSNIYLERESPNRHGSLYIEKHYVQVLLYYGVLRYNFALSDRSVDVRLLYSKFPADRGLLSVEMYRALFVEALRFRNRVVAGEFFMARSGFERVVDHITPDTLNTEHMDGFFYRTWLLPQIEQTAAPLHSMPPLERAYFCRMMTFVLREQMLAKVGTQEGQGNCAADLWNMPLSEKIDTGNIYVGLTIASRTRSSENSGFDTIKLNVPRQAEDFLPNFRLGDMVYLYAYEPDTEPDARRGILFKGVLADTHATHITVRLNDAQNNPNIFASHNVYAVEHAGSDIGTASAMHSLYELITCGADRRALLLSQRAPRRNASRRLTRSYDALLDDLLLRVRQAEDMFLLVGPPGTGKTSRALRFIVEEELADNEGTLLLMSYTNRAVDEICAMLADASVDFLRIGNEYSCDAAFRGHLVGSLAADDARLSDITGRIRATRVIVGTTSSIMARPFIFSLKHFTLAVVDEAGQITEPNIIGLLAAHAPDDPGRQIIDRFILVGDYKQLPAVVQQEESEAEITDPLLRDIGLRSCRDSLFERLVRHERAMGRSDFLGVLHRQGRMHPAIAEYPDSRFYAFEQLQPVPLPHQCAQSLDYDVPSEDALDDFLKAHRMIFIPSEPCSSPSLSDKVNADEARRVADLLRRIRRFYGPRFSAAKTVGVIVPYRNQIAMIRKEIERLGMAELENVSIDTVERYQGSQRDVIIYSFTVHRHWQLEFLAANRLEEDGHVIDRKLNVAMTRARCQMIMTGNRSLLASDSVFADMIAYVESKGGVWGEVAQ